MLLLLLQWQGVLTVVILIYFSTIMNQASNVALHFNEQC